MPKSKFSKPMLKKYVKIIDRALDGRVNTARLERTTKAIFDRSVSAEKCESMVNQLLGIQE